MPKKATKKASASTRSLVDIKTADPISVDLLDLDPDNPRLPEDASATTQDELLLYMAENYNPMEVAQSIVKNGFFGSEPLIAVKDDGRYTVVEGNRRLAALRLLNEPDLAQTLGVPDADSWYELGVSASPPDKVPVVVAESRSEVQPLVGYRHISGIRPWDPRERARFVAKLVDEQKETFEAAADIVGESERSVRDLYRNHRIGNELLADHEVDPKRLGDRFGVLTRAMQDSRIREFIGAPDAKDVQPRRRTLDRTKAANARLLAHWLFDAAPLIKDSRQLPKLGRIVVEKRAVRYLIERRDFEGAYEAAGGVQDHLFALLGKAKSALEDALLIPRRYRASAAAKAQLKDIDDLVERCREE